MYKQTEKTATCPNKQFQPKIQLSSLSLSHEEKNKVIFVWANKSENNCIFTNHSRNFKLLSNYFTWQILVIFA